MVDTSAQIEMYLPEIERFQVFQGMQRNDIKKFLENGRVRGTRHREILYRQGVEAHQFSLVLRGAYKLVRPTPRGEDVIVYFSSPGDVIAALVMPQPQSTYPVTAVSMGPSLILEIPRTTYLSAWIHDTQLTVRLQNLLFNRMSFFQDQKTLNKSPLLQKVAHLLLELMDKYSVESEGILPIPLTRKEIADSLGSTVESVIRIMSDLSRQGILQTTEHHIQVLEPDKVIQILKEDE